MFIKSHYNKHFKNKATANFFKVEYMGRLKNSIVKDTSGSIENSSVEDFVGMIKLFTTRRRLHPRALIYKTIEQYN